MRRKIVGKSEQQLTRKKEGWQEFAAKEYQN
jgi:hypothetical protein